ncbi:hypothetical protein BDP27DRAFT_1424215 [Rhodocollybia butyracea]|uniref:DUF6534 domain-containing protein n=1 Tax=Rhodocollybia butyracea TaxID=206335 RepID=A0A9P5PMM9_9AGAR|nr:hypothetical protein BDP27DRAFT_1424215 [Rhodocollybia butyracea]
MASNPATLPVPGLALDLSGIDGGLYISTHVVSVLWGISCLQIFTYFIQYVREQDTNYGPLRFVSYPKDKAIFKILENILGRSLVVSYSSKIQHIYWAHARNSRSILTVQHVCVIQPEYFLLITSWGNPAALSVDPIESSVQALMTVLAALITQCFFTYRLYIFTSRRLLFPMIFVSTMRFNTLIPSDFIRNLVKLPLIIGQLVVEAIALKISFATHNNQQLKAKSFISPTIASNAFPVAIDAGIAACMTYWLFKESKGITGSHVMIVRLITLTINSGFWTASVALAVFVGSIVGSDEIYGTIYYLLGPLYCNTVLANLNAREYLRAAQESEEIAFRSNLNFEAAAHSTIATSVSFAAQSSHYPPFSGEHSVLSASIRFNFPSLHVLSFLTSILLDKEG